MSGIHAKKRKRATGARWTVQGFNGTDAFFRETLPVTSWSDSQIVCLLQRLLCRHLEAADIIDGSRAPRDQFYNAVLKEHRDTKGKRLTIMVGTDPYYVASVWQADEEDK
jgi:hypothetical protein